MGGGVGERARRGWLQEGEHRQKWNGAEEGASEHKRFVADPHFT